MGMTIAWALRLGLLTPAAGAAWLLETHPVAEFPEGRQDEYGYLQAHHQEQWIAGTGAQPYIQAALGAI
eukprot:21211-Prorocentrum_lima.AAC.1